MQFIKNVAYCYFEPDESFIVFSKAELPKLITVFERALNTLSPMDPELLKVLEDMKEVK